MESGAAYECPEVQGDNRLVQKRKDDRGVIPYLGRASTAETREIAFVD